MYNICLLNFLFIYIEYIKNSMKITEIPNNIRLSGVKKKKGNAVSEGAFSGMLEETDSVQETSDTETSISVNSVISADVMSVLNSAQDDSFNKKLNIEWGRDILEDLERIRNQILMGVISERALHQVEEKLKNIPLESEDLKLKNIVEEIRTRAAVELAKLARFKG